MNTRYCNKCGVELVLGENWLLSMAENRTYECRVCVSRRTTAWGRANPERRRRAEIKSRLKRDFGITPEDYNEMLEAQDGLCAICRKSPEENGERLCVDHDHVTSKVRGLLCRSCNMLLGLAQDNPKLLQVAVWYLQEAGSE